MHCVRQKWVHPRYDGRQKQPRRWSSRLWSRCEIRASRKGCLTSSSEWKECDYKLKCVTISIISNQGDIFLKIKFQKWGVGNVVGSTLVVRTDRRYTFWLSNPLVAACLQRTKWLCRGFDDVLAPRLPGSGTYGHWCGGSGEGGLHPWPVRPKSKHCRICPAATEKWEWYSSNACRLNSHGMHYRLVSAKSSLRRLGLWKL